MNTGHDLNVNNFKSLILDLDGTLIGRDERISPRVADAVLRCAKHLDVSIATGREPSDAIKFARELGLTTPQVSDNGALILNPHDGSEVWSAPLDPKHAKHILTRLDSIDAEFIATHPGGTIREFEQITHWNITRVSALDMIEEAANEVVNYFAASVELHVVKVFLPYNSLWAVDFTRAGINKATAARKLGEMAGIQTSNMIAAGDSYNDLQLLEVCGLRIVMGDAPDELKAFADYIAPSVDDDGLAVALEEVVIPMLG